MNSSKHTELANHAWSVADLLRGDYKQSDYGKVILPFTVLRRLECVLEPTKEKVRETAARFAGQDVDVARFLRKASGHSFYNTSQYTLKVVAGDSSQAAKHLLAYIGAFSENAQEVLEKYDFAQQIRRLDGANLLYRVVGAVRGPRPAARGGLQPPDGVRLRGADPALRGAVERDGR